MMLTSTAHPMIGSYKPKLKRDAGTVSPNNYRRSLQSRSLARVVVAILVVIVVISAVRHRYNRGVNNLETLAAEEIVLGNCVSIEALRHVDECFENVEFARGKNNQKPQRKVRTKSSHLEHEENIPWISSYGLVLDYDAAYDRLGGSEHEEHYTTKRTLKCLTGFHMSIVWDFEFSTSLLTAYKSGTFGLTPDASDKVALSCPSLDSETSTSMSIKINCGFDIQRDAWGHPAEESDHAELETCIRMAWAWVKGRTGDQEVGPWAKLCGENEFGETRCDSSTFHLEGAD